MKRVAVSATTLSAIATLLVAPIVPVYAQTPPPTTPVPQPSAPTPPTPRPTKTPATDPTGVRPQDVKVVPRFPNADPGQPQPGDPAAIESLQQALEIAFRRNPGILIAEEQTVRTRRLVDQIAAIRRPQITAGVTYTRLSGINAFGSAGGGASLSSVQNPFNVGLTTTPPGSIPITLSGGTGSGAGGGTGSAGATPAGGASQATGGSAATSRSRQTSGDQTGNQGGNQGGGGGLQLNQESARISISQLIDITGVVRTALEVGDLQEALTRLELARTRQETALNVKNGYYNVLRAEAFLRVNEAAVAQSEELLRVTRAQQAAGVASAFDVLRAQTQLDNNRQALITSRNQIGITRNAFANLLGIDPSTPVRIMSPDAPPLPNLDEAALVTQALTQRPEYLQADVNILKSQKNTRLARRNLEPFVNAGISGVFNATSGVPSDQRGAAALSITLNLPLSDGGATRAAIDVARADERAALIQKDQYVRGIKAEVQQAIIAVRDANERAGVASGTVTQAREALRLSNVRFRAGVGTQLEINDAQTALTQAETNEVNARYDYLGALARLSRAIGNPE